MPRPRKEASDAPAAPEPVEASLPKAVRLKHPYGYYTENNVLRAWDVDHVETDTGEIANLIARGAPVIAHEGSE